jgi:hypothetical protein
MEVKELFLCDTVIAHLVEAYGNCPDGESLEWLRFQCIYKVSGTYTDGQMGVVVLAGMGVDEVVHVVNCRLTDRSAIEARRKGLGCSFFHREWGDGVDDPLLEPAHILGRLNNDAYQPEILVGQSIVADRSALPFHRLLCAQHFRYSFRDFVEVRRSHKLLEQCYVRRVVGIQGETMRKILS